MGTPARQRQLHYWLQLSERDPSKDPVILWLNGGPGASSIMYGALTEMGQLVHTSRSLRDNTTEAPLLAYNPHSWSRVASVIYLESPAGVGFSYCEYEPCGGATPWHTQYRRYLLAQSSSCLVRDAASYPYSTARQAAGAGAD